MADRICEYESCDAPLYVRGLCRPHYRRMLRAGTPDGLRAKRGGPCAVQGCSSVAEVRNHCSLHYGRLRKTGSVERAWPRMCPCAMCGDEFRQSTWNQLRCEDCRAEVLRERDREYYLHNRDRVKASTRAYYFSNIEKQREWHRSHRLKILDARKEYEREWRRANPEKRRFAEKRRQAVKRGASSIPFTAEQLRHRLSMFGNKCWMCGSAGPHLDHVKPLSKGGIHALSNIRPACVSCNSAKGSRWPFVAETTGVVTPRLEIV